MASFKVRVVNEDDKAIENARVRLEFTGLTRGMSGEQHTDADGIAHFDGYEEGPINIYLNGSNYGGSYYENGEQVSVWV